MQLHRTLAPTLGSLALAGCLIDVPELGETSREAYVPNKLTSEQILANGLIGNHEALQTLISEPLATATFDPETGALPYPLNDPDTRAFMHYLTACALSPEHPPVVFTDLWGETHRFEGGLGLCEEWGDGAPGQPCLEAVSACLLARNNKEGLSVQISLRGRRPDGTAVPLAKAVTAKTTLVTGETIASFEDCPQRTAGPDRNCGWTASRSLLGMCESGQPITLPCAPDSTAMAARVCDGVAGCNSGDPEVLAQETVCTPSNPSIEFDCGADGAFAVMLGAPSSDSLPIGGLSAGGGAIFPAPESLLFAVDEGAFFGDLFKPTSHLHVEVDASGNKSMLFLTSSPNPYPFADAWSCHAPSWVHADAYMHHRLCAVVFDDQQNSQELCVANNLGPCIGGTNPVCSSSDGPPVAGDLDFAGCEDPQDNKRPALTSTLHDACDLVGAPSHLCARR